MAVSNVVGRFTKNRCDESDNTVKEEEISVDKKTRTRKRKNTEQHEYCEENKVRRKEVHAQRLNNLSNCTEVKVLGEGAFGKVSLYRRNDTKMDYAVKELKRFDPGSYEIERKILELGNSTWNLFLSALCGEFFYEGCRYLVLEFMLAGDLQKVFNLHKKLFSELQARFYIAEIICGLEYLHLQGVKPFHNKVIRDLYNSIVMDEVEYRPKLSEIAWNLLTQLLEKNPLRRIGYKGGSNPWIRKHEFFQSLNWDQLEQRNIEPPWNPRKRILLE
ncbi:protein kinase C-like [Orbicella faveolata]|uniref:protein kinase C-like n=1 Tax=Orbicella faveolata TaxID=48498 RepID=UPI0009E5453C|nr:protein kinase C-like [Orbicella faveolata]